MYSRQWQWHSLEHQLPLHTLGFCLSLVWISVRAWLGHVSLPYPFTSLSLKCSSCPTLLLLVVNFRLLSRNSGQVSRPLAKVFMNCRLLFQPNTPGRTGISLSSHGTQYRFFPWHQLKAVIQFSGFFIVWQASEVRCCVISKFVTNLSTQHSAWP